jgi:hypothetical protein
MRDIFTQSDSACCYFIEYISSFVDPVDENFNMFQLPPIQRNSVWNVAQIERLWDSIMRGYPIGSFLVAPRKKGDKARDLFNGRQVSTDDEGYYLLDGQQRTRAILLGFKSIDNARLWIDLNPSLKFDNSEFNDRKFMFRVLTSYQPWGMDDRNPSSKLSEHTKYTLRYELRLESLRYDYQVKINTSNSNAENTSWPGRASLPIPFDLLVKMCGGSSGMYSNPDWEEILTLIPKRYHDKGLVPSEPTDYFATILDSLRPLLSKPAEGQRCRSVVLLLQSDVETVHDEEQKGDMETLFTRVNAGGTVLQGEEMAYSLLKASWDEAYEMVSSIVNDKTIGYLLSSTGIVIAAARLARFIQNEPDTATPGVANFRRWIGKKGQGNSFLEVMQQLLIEDENHRSVFHKVMKTFCEIAAYEDSTKDDIGLPKKLLLEIKPQMYHPVFIWIHANINKQDLIQSNRVNIVRYLMISFLTVEKPEKASREAIEIVRLNLNQSFPDAQIYHRWLERKFAVKIPTPEQFNIPFNKLPDGFLRTGEELFNIQEDEFNIFRKWFWSDSNSLLLWYQRKFASNWFKGYDPTSTDAFDTPYDYDHIVPKSHLITSGASPVTYSKERELNVKFDWNRSLYINSIGNYRLWPFWGNRSDSNRCHTEKLKMETPVFNDAASTELDLHSVHEYLRASAISTEDESLWYDAGGDVREWPQERRLSWQTAVEKRVCYLYQLLYGSFSFDKLISNIDHTPKPSAKPENNIGI